MQVDSFIEVALRGCSVPLDIKPDSLKQNSNNFYNYCYNYIPNRDNNIERLDTNNTNHLFDPEGNIIKPALPGRWGISDSQTGSLDAAKSEIGIKLFPSWPADLFAVTASLLERSGAYQLVKPSDRSYRKGIYLNGKPINSKDEFDKEFFEGIDFEGTLTPGGEDIFGVCDANRYILRYIGLLWASGALTVIFPTDISSSTTNQELLRNIDLVVEENIGRAKSIPTNFTDLYSNEIDHSIYNKFQAKLKSYTKQNYLTPLETGSSPSNHNFVRDNQNLDNHYFIRYLMRMAINKEFVGGMNSNEDFNETEGFLLRSRNSPVNAALDILWAIDYINRQWSILVSTQSELSPFNAAILSENLTGGKHHSHIEWYRAAIRLFIIADEACRAIGFSDRASGSRLSMSEKPDHPDYDYDNKLYPGLSTKLIWEAFKDDYSNALFKHNQTLQDDSPEKLLPLLPRTLTRCFDDELGSVLPKARTSQVGCTIRSLSHNVALLPARGRVRARWARNPSGDSRETLNILLIPYPFEINSRDFQVSNGSEDDSEPWGSFSVYPGWLYGYDENSVPKVDLPIAYTEKPSSYKAHIDECHKNLLDFILSLTSSLPGEEVDAIVFPEAALTYEAFHYLAEELPKFLPKLEILISGLSTAPKNMNPLDVDVERVKGNFVATYIQDASKLQEKLHPTTVDETNEPSSSRYWPVRHIRGKHHRWKLDSRQLTTYALSSRLRPNKSWWEDFDIRPRGMLFSEFLSGSVLTALICEDLARIEPCQAAIRAVGPNLVIVLLMDAAQVRGRWPHQYAGVLADDPGSSVLTLTSYGLIERSSKSMGHDSRAIGMWREPNGATKIIDLPVDARAQLLTLRSEHILERTLDSRTDNGDSAVVWKFAGLSPIKGQK